MLSNWGHFPSCPGLRRQGVVRRCAGREINICRSGTAAAACTLTEAVLRPAVTGRAAANRDYSTGGEVSRP